jgi:phosphoribosylaminoimidazolecarboxamide formyltransferase/IMP cyclohydrolase
MTEDRRPIRRALISVYDKSGLEALVRALADAKVAIVSSGGTAALIASYGVPVTKVEELTGFPECLDGRVKTLHPSVHGGLLADLRRPEHRAQLDELGIEPFDLLVSNLYPFRETVASGADPEAVIEQIDIGGPAMVRAAAKNHANVAVVTSPEAYPDVIAAVAAGGLTLPHRRRLAARAFADIAAYDVAVARWFAEGPLAAGDGSGLAQEAELTSADGATADATASENRPWPAFAGQALTLATTLRYGENPHQRAALYVDGDAPVGLARAEQLGGKEMSYNNYVDADSAWRTVHDFEAPAVAIIKHANPCGIAIGSDVVTAHRLAHECDPASAYGGVIAVNRPVTVDLAQQVAEIFTEVIVAPSYVDDALAILAARKNLRILRAPAYAQAPVEYRQISGGVLAQTPDRIDAAGDDPSSWRLVTGEPVPADVLADLAFAWRAVRAVKSNAILLARGGASVGIGMGQVNRVDSARLAVTRAGDRAAGSVAASDAFFPFPDGLEILIDGGVRAVVQPGGSIRDEQVVEAAAKAGIALYFTGTRHFYH